ncbi:MAG: hypothetical protein ACYDG2_04755 [Ruminiclostridium sp.]
MEVIEPHSLKQRIVSVVSELLEYYQI